MPSITGRIIAVQETRFRLETIDGRNLLLTLASGANADSADLRHWQKRNQAVLVAWDGRPGFDDAVVQQIRPVSPQKG